MGVTVGAVMTPEPIAIGPQAPLKQAIATLAEEGIGALPVVDDTGKLVGLLSEADVMWQESGVDTPPYVVILDSTIYLKNPLDFARELHKAIGQTVAEVMGKPPATVKPDTLLRDAARYLHGDGVACVVAIDDQGKPIGILTRGDVIRAMAAGLM